MIRDNFNEEDFQKSMDNFEKQKEMEARLEEQRKRFLKNRIAFLVGYISGNFLLFLVFSVCLYHLGNLYFPISFLSCLAAAFIISYTKSLLLFKRTISTVFDLFLQPPAIHVANISGTGGLY